LNGGKFDIALFLGVLYQLRHPLLALDILCGLCTDTLRLDEEEAAHIQSPTPGMEFHENDELGGRVHAALSAGLSGRKASSRP